MNETEDRFPVTEWEFDDLRLRLCRESDTEDMVLGCGDPQTQRYITLLPSPYTDADARMFIAELAPASWKRGHAQWAIADAASDRLLGCISIPRVQPGFGCAEIGYWVAPWARGRNIAARVAPAVADFMFQHGIARAELHVAAGNIASQRAALRCGFALDGRLRGGMVTREGERVDRLIFARLAGDPPGPVPRAIPDLPGGELTDGVVTLRRLCAADADAHFERNSLPEVWQRYVPPVEPSRENTDRMCEYGAAEQWLHGNVAHMSIRDAETDAYAGEFAVHVAMGPPGEVMLSYSLGRQWRGRGFVGRAVRLASVWAVKEVGARRVMAGTAPDNAASQAVLVRAGFTNEGVQRALLPGLNDTRVDNVCWSLLPDEL